MRTVKQVQAEIEAKRQEKYTAADEGEAAIAEFDLRTLQMELEYLEYAQERENRNRQSR